MTVIDKLKIPKPVPFARWDNEDKKCQHIFAQDKYGSVCFIENGKWGLTAKVVGEGGMIDIESYSLRNTALGEYLEAN